jgi:NADH-quinone oxidoreductase subunit F
MMLFTVCGDVRQEGVFELPLGTPLRYLVEDLAGGPAEGRSFKAFFPGSSNTVLAPTELDVPLDFDSMRQVGSGLGSAGFAAFDDSACMVRAAHLYSRFLYVESCGQCPACKFGTGETTRLLAEVESERASDQSVESILIRARGSLLMPMSTRGSQRSAWERERVRRLRSRERSFIRTVSSA